MEDHVLMYLDEGMVELTENNHTTRLTSGDCAFIRKDCNVMMNKKCIDGKTLHGHVPYVQTQLPARDFPQLRQGHTALERATQQQQRDLRPTT